VWTVIVVVALELAEHGCGVLSVDDQKTVEEFAADGADEAFGDRVGQRRQLHRIGSMRPIGIGGCG
jgi:hypothetical protein